MIRFILAVLGILLFIAVIFVLVAKRDQLFLRGEKETQLIIDLQKVKPETWKPIYEKGLLEVNVDGDDVTEWLFLYRNQGDTGQIGGIIYDAQNRPKDETSLALPQQTSAYLIPYPLMPDYPPTKNQGYLADEAIQCQGIFTDDREQEESGRVITGDRLQFRGIYRGRTSRVSLFWWLDQRSGYAGALAYTPGWFSTSKDNPNWPNWPACGEKSVPEKIETLWAWEPQMDRSNICRRVEWRLVGMQFIADYEHSDITFCSGLSSGNNELLLKEPAFPEAQVLAYLLKPDPGRWKNPDRALSLPGPAKVLRISEPVVTDAPPERPVSDVDVDFLSQGREYHMVWRVEMQPPARINDTVHWRIIGARNR